MPTLTTPAGARLDHAMSNPPCPICGHLLPTLLAKRVIVHTGRSGVYACAWHTDAQYERVRADRLAEYDDRDG